MPPTPASRGKRPNANVEMRPPATAAQSGTGVRGLSTLFVTDIDRRARLQSLHFPEQFRPQFDHSHTIDGNLNELAGFSKARSRSALVGGHLMVNGCGWKFRSNLNKFPIATERDSDSGRIKHLAARGFPSSPGNAGSGGRPWRVSSTLSAERSRRWPIRAIYRTFDPAVPRRVPRFDCRPVQGTRIWPEWPARARRRQRVGIRFRSRACRICPRRDDPASGRARRILCGLRRGG